MRFTSVSTVVAEMMGLAHFSNLLRSYGGELPVQRAFHKHNVRADCARRYRRCAVGEKVGHVVADLAEIDRQLASVGTPDGILARKSADFSITSSIIMDGLWRLVR